MTLATIKSRLHQFKTDHWSPVNKRDVWEFDAAGDDNDDTDFATLITAANATANGIRLRIKGRLKLRSVHDAAKINELFAVPGGGIEYTGGTTETDGGALWFGTKPNLATLSAAAEPIEAVVAGQGHIEFTGSVPAGIEQGARIVIMSDDAMPTNHTAEYLHKPAEIHTVLKAVPIVSGYSTTDWEINGSFHNAFTTNARVAVLPALQNGVYIHDIEMATFGTPSTLLSDVSGQPLYFSGCTDVVMERVRQVAPAPGQIHFQCIDGLRVQGNDFSSKFDPNATSLLSFHGYGIALSMCKSTKISHNKADYQRHFVTTSTGWTEDQGGGIFWRYGGPLDWTVEGNDCYSQSESLWDAGDARVEGSATITIDSHAEGYRGRITGNTIRVGKATGTGINALAINLRSIDNVIEDNEVIHGGVGSAIRVSGPGNTVRNNLVRGGWKGVELLSAFSSSPDDCVVDGNDFRDMVGYGLDHKAGDRVTYVNNKHSNCGSDGTTNALVHIGAGTDHKINKNVLTKGPNDLSVKFSGGVDDSDIAEFIGNDISGYPACGLGFDIATTAGRILDEKWREQNNAPRVTHLYESGHGLDSTDDLYAPLISDGSVADDTVLSSKHVGVYMGHDGDAICIRRPGEPFAVEQDSIMTGTYTHGGVVELYWDESATRADSKEGAYVETQPSDSVMAPVLRVLSQSGTQLTVEVMDLGTSELESSNATGPTYQTLTVGSSIDYDAALGVNAILATPGSGNTIENISNVVAGDSGQLTIQGGSNTPSFGSNWDFGPDDGWTLTNDTDLADILTWSVAENGTIHTAVAQGYLSPF